MPCMHRHVYCAHSVAVLTCSFVDHMQLQQERHDGSHVAARLGSPRNCTSPELRPTNVCRTHLCVLVTFRPASKYQKSHRSCRWSCCAC